MFACEENIHLKKIKIKMHRHSHWKGHSQLEGSAVKYCNGWAQMCRRRGVQVQAGSTLSPQN